MKIGITGCTGRVGALLIKELLSGKWNGLELAGGTTRSKKIVDEPYFITDNADDLFKRADMVIDFTLPEATRQHIKLAEKHKTPILIATTGLSENDEKAIKALSQTVPVIYAANTSIAVTVLTALVEKAASAMGSEFDIEIIEAHHKHKIDAPSGTALMLGRTAAHARDEDFTDIAKLSREGETGPRPKGEIGFATIRGGDAVGEHTVMFLGEGERLELKQQASDRVLYARGALRAALWIANNKLQSGLFTMRDVLNL